MVTLGGNKMKLTDLFEEKLEIEAWLNNGTELTGAPHNEHGEGNDD